MRGTIMSPFRGRLVQVGGDADVTCEQSFTELVYSLVASSHQLKLHQPVYLTRLFMVKTNLLNMTIYSKNYSFTIGGVKLTEPQVIS